MIRDGLLSTEGQDRQVARTGQHDFYNNNLCLLPQFNERDPDTLFCLVRVHF